jgi:2-keto-4-pentenoate hydratase/2-oxohepta-3-ene-1,7-dioic acid hydratase in catechol pathway
VPGEVTLGEAHTTYPGRYKASDTFAPMGPFLVTRDEIPDPAALTIECRLGDTLVASIARATTCGASPLRSRTSRAR